MNSKSSDDYILIISSAKFIGANLMNLLLKEINSGTIVALDNINDNYDVLLRE